jgi:hypothetical protein
MAKEPLLVHRINKSIIGFTEKDQDLLMSVKENVPFEIQTKGIKNKIGASHMRLYWACCTFMVNQLCDKDLDNKYKIDTALRHELKFYDLDKCVIKFENEVAVLVIMVLMSISMKNINAILKKDYFNKAIKKMAEMLGNEVDTFVKEVQSQMLDKHGKYSNKESK